MAKRYVTFKHFERGVPNTNPSSQAKYRSCMHCGSRAHWTAVKRTGNFRMDVRFCDDHKLIMDEINARAAS